MDSSSKFKNGKFTTVNDMKMKKQLDSPVIRADEPQSKLVVDSAGYVEWLVSRGQEQELEENNKQEWVTLGKIIDRLMAYICLFLLVLETTIFLALLLV